MLDAVRRYATKILLLHLVLLVVVVGIVLIAAREVYHSARQQAIAQDGKRLDLLADQTARGIENHYLSIMQDLELILRDESDAALTQPRVPLERGRFNLRRFNESKTVPVTPALTGIMWRQLRGRVSHLVLVDTETGRVLAAFPDAGGGTQGDVVKAMVKEHLGWFKTLKEPSMSRFQKAGETGEHGGGGEGSGGYHLIAIPALGTGGFVGGPREPAREGGRGGPGQNAGREAGSVREALSTSRTVVAMVPIQTVKDRFFDPLNDKGVVNAALLDDTGAVLVSIHPELAGKNLLSIIEPAVGERLGPFIAGREKGPVVVGETSRVGSINIEPRILAFEPIENLPGRRWTVLTSAPVSESDALVNEVFRGALAWGIFLTLSLTAVLVSTAFFMIRGRIRLERTRHELLTRELEQARQIQLAWLPDLEHVPAGVEVFATNLPASHISGDFYNWFSLPAAETDRPAEGSGKVAVVIGDVTGHGMAAAFLMATTQWLVRMTLSRYQDPGRCLREVNRQLCTQGFRGQFVTMVVMVLDPASRSAEVAVAGHPAPLVQRDGGFAPLTMEPQLVLGVDPQEQYKTAGFVLERGSSVLLYTDGVVEAEAASGEQYGVGRLAGILKREGAVGPEARVQGVLEDVKRFCGGRELHDDVTLVGVRVGG